MSNSDKKIRSWVFTLNNYTEQDIEFLKGLMCKYIIFGREVAPTTGTQHLQGYIEFANPRTKTGILKKMELSNEIYLAPRMGTPEQAREYCLKGTDIFENGELPMKNGQRKGLKEACEKVLSGASIEEIAVEYPDEFVRYSAGLKALSTTKVKPRDPNIPPNVIWLWGLAGTGKTRRAYESHKKVYIKDGTQWWDGYEGQEAIIIDDFEAVEWNYRDFLRLLDRYPYRGQFKGGYVNVNSPYVYITCEYHPCMIWKGNKLAQVTRRLTEITEVKGKMEQGCLDQGDLGNIVLGHQNDDEIDEEGENRPIFDKLVKSL